MADNNVATAKAYVKGLAIAPRKVSIVASLIRGRSIDDALVILDHTPRRAALPIKKAIESAKSNAINNHGVDAKNIEITKVIVSVGDRLKRFKPASRGRALPFQRKTSNILIEVTGTARKAAPKKATAAPKDSSSEQSSEENKETK